MYAIRSYYANIRTLKAIGECDVAVVMIDSIIGLEKQDQKIIDEVVRWRKGLIIAVNKWDLVEKESTTAAFYEKAVYQKMGAIDYAEIVITSYSIHYTKLYDFASKERISSSFAPE